jgi:hypothetical protein
VATPRPGLVPAPCLLVVAQFRSYIVPLVIMAPIR